MNMYCPINDGRCYPDCAFYVKEEGCNYNGSLNYVAVIDNRLEQKIKGICCDEQNHKIPYVETPRFFALRADGKFSPIYFEDYAAWVEEPDRDSKYCDNGYGFFKEMEEGNNETD